MQKEGVEEEYSKAVGGYLGLVIDRTLMFTSSLTRWKPDAESPVDIFSRQALPMTWDYAENNPKHDFSGGLSGQIGRILYSLQKVFVSAESVTVTQSSATSRSRTPKTISMQS
jgi:putative DNA methylase